MLNIFCVMFLFYFAGSVRCGALFFVFGRMKMYATNKYRARVCMCKLESSDFPLCVCEWFLFWVRLRLNRSVFVCELSVLFEVMPLVGLLSTSSSSDRFSSSFLQCAFVFYIFNIPAHQIKRLGPNTQMQTAYPNTYYHITSVHKKAHRHRRQAEKKQHWTSNLLCISNHLHVQCWWQRWRSCCWCRCRCRHQLCSVIAFVLLFVLLCFSVLRLLAHRLSPLVFTLFAAHISQFYSLSVALL